MVMGGELGLLGKVVDSPMNTVVVLEFPGCTVVCTEAWLLGKGVDNSASTVDWYLSMDTLVWGETELLRKIVDP